jgi:DNA-binding transcriptional MerR regulator
MGADRRIADRVRVNTKTVRYYESIGLVPQPPRTAAACRICGAEDVARWASSGRRNAWGLGLEEIREVLRLRDAGTAPCEHVRGMLSRADRSVGG